MKPPRTGIKIGIGLQILAVLVIYALANYLGSVHYERRDFSRSQKFSLAGQTRAVLKEFTQPVEILVVASPTLFSPVTPVLADLRSLLNEVLFNKRDGLRVEYVDPTRNIQRAQELKAKYNLADLDSVLILEYDDRHRVLNIAEMGEFDLSVLAQGGAPVLLAFRGEQVLTSAMMSLLKPEAETVYFLEGHGETSPGRQTGKFAEAISHQNASVKPLSLAGSDAIPADASAVVIAGAQTDLEEREVAVLGAWLRAGGKMLVLLNPNAATPRLHSLLANSGIIPRNDRVLRLIELPFATGILRDVTAQVLPNAEITRRLEGMNLLFPGATQSLGMDLQLARSEKIRIRPLVQPAEEFWGETDYAPNQPQGVAYQDGIDFGQPIVIAASADRDGVEDDRVDVQTSRLIVVGSCQFALDASLTPPGLDFLVGAVNALIDRGNLSGITPKNITRFNLRLTDEQLSKLALAVMLGMPGLAAFVGLFVWFKRRS
ncbi:MAG: Gldg family protein [Spartobacteria bacterium]